jgi:hypothetical protein
MAPRNDPGSDRPALFKGETSQSACLAGIDSGAYPHVLQAHDGPDVMRHRNMRTCVGNRRALLHRQAY